MQLDYEGMAALEQLTDIKLSTVVPRMTARWTALELCVLRAIQLEGVHGV